MITEKRPRSRPEGRDHRRRAKGAGIILGDKDMVIPAAEEKVAADQMEVVIQRYAAVAITDLGEKKEYDKIKGLTIQEVLDQENITLGEKDEIEPAADTVLSEDMTEVQIRRYAKVTIKHEDEETQVELVGGTVEDALKEAGIELGEKEEGREKAHPLTLFYLQTVIHSLFTHSKPGL